MSWYSALKKIKSKGQLMPKCNSLSELHDRRSQHKGQFFTSSPMIRRAIWEIIDFYSIADERRVFFDNSIGTGSLIWNADPERDSVYGFDVDGEKLSLLADALENAGFVYELLHCGLEDSRCSGSADFAIINPPFSIHLESPNLEPYAQNSYGAYGPFKSAASHEYALEQALSHSQFTVAVLPTSFANLLLSENKPGLCGIWDLPKSAFKSAGANVATSIVLFRNGYYQYNGPVVLGKINGEFNFNGVDGVKPLLKRNNFSIKKLGMSTSEPVITLPVTDCKTVEVHHNGRKIMLRFQCGFMQAKVMNKLLKKRIRSNFENKPLPKGIKYSGDGVFDVEIHLIQNDPLLSLNKKLIYPIIDCGGKPDVSPSLIGHIKNRIKLDKRTILPMGHVYYGGKYSGTAKYKARRDVLVTLESLVSPVVLKDDIISVSVVESGGIYTYKGKDYLIGIDRLNSDFDLINGGDDAWQVRSESKAVEYPELYNQWYKKALALGIDRWLDRDYQLNDLIEGMIHGRGYVCGWDMGLGKSRKAMSLVALSGVKHGLIIVSPRLIHEFLRQIKTDLCDYISMDDVNVISDAESAANLKQFNFISTSRLRMLVDKKTSKNRTFAKALRRRVGLVIVDEAHFVSNFNTNQSRAIVALSARKLIALSGTIMGNYPRNLHPVLNLFGDGTAYQPWGYHNGKLDPRLIDNYGWGRRGPKAFMDEFVTIDWCTYEFENEMRGAKREIPKIANLDSYRDALAPFIKRRVLAEPDVCKYFELPELDEHFIYLDWDPAHLEHYLKVSKEFASFWRKVHEEKSSLSGLLPRINAILKASSRPHVPIGDLGCHVGQTPKDKYTVDWVGKWDKQGKKSIVYAASPDTVSRLCGYLESSGVSCLPYHGDITHKERARLLEDEFKKGDAMCIVATTGCLSEGENLQDYASKVLFFERHWSAKTESQCKTRVLRPGQKDVVDAYYLHYTGGIDCYIKQLVDYKKDCFNAGIDYASPELFENEFLHMEKILAMFVEELPKLESKSKKAA